MWGVGPGKAVGLTVCVCVCVSNVRTSEAWTLNQVRGSSLALPEILSYLGMLESKRFTSAY